MDDDLRRLIDDGVVGIKRLVAHGMRKFTMVFLKDDSTNPVGPVVCPCCKRMHYQAKGLIHKMFCVVPNGYKSGAYRASFRNAEKGYGVTQLRVLDWCKRAKRALYRSWLSHLLIHGRDHKTRQIAGFFIGDCFSAPR